MRYRRYIGYALLVSVISVSVKLNRYANPGPNPLLFLKSKMLHLLLQEPTIFYHDLCNGLLDSLWLFCILVHYWQMCENGLMETHLNTSETYMQLKKVSPSCIICVLLKHDRNVQLTINPQLPKPITRQTKGHDILLCLVSTSTH